MRRLAAALAVTSLALLLPACSGGRDGDTYVLDVRGAADVTGKGPVRHLRTGRHHLGVGQRVGITRGTAVLGLPGDTSLELRRGSTVEVGPRPTLVEGAALAVADGDDLSIAAGDTRVELHDGAARIRRSAGVTVAVYQGSVDVAALGNRMAAPVMALRQTTISDSGVLPRRPVPLVYDRRDPDPWDTRYLNDAIDLGTQLDRQVRVLNARPAPAVVDLAYLRSTVPALRSASGLSADLVNRTARSVGETIVGASIAVGGSGNVASRWEDAFEFRQDGADWGLVALDQRARRARVLAVLGGVLDRVVRSITPIAVGGVGGVGPSGTSGVTTTVPGRPSPTPTTSPSPGGTAAPAVPATPVTPILPPITLPLLPSSPTPTTPTRPSSPTSPAPTPTTLLAPVQGLLDGLLGTGGSSPAPSGGSGSGGVVGGLLDTVGGLLGGH